MEHGAVRKRKGPYLRWKTKVPMPLNSDDQLTALVWDSDQPENALSSDETEIFGIQDEIFTDENDDQPPPEYVPGTDADLDSLFDDLQELIMASVDTVNAPGTSTSTVKHVGVKSKSSGASSSGSSTKTAAQKKFGRMIKLRELQLKRNEARKLNHAEVVEEDRRNKLPSNYEARKRKGEWILQEEEKRKAAEAKGEDYDRVKVMDVTAEDADRWERKKKRKNPDQGFSDYEQASYRQYQRLTKQMKPDMAEYGHKKDKMGTDMYPSVDSLMQGTHKDSEEGINRMVADLEKQIEKRSKYSRRRAFNEEDDIDYINERNMRFNKKIERFYGKYTTEIKQNLERGTAV